MATCRDVKGVTTLTAEKTCALVIFKKEGILDLHHCSHEAELPLMAKADTALQ